MYAFKVTSFNYLRGFIEEMGVSRGLSTYPFSLLDQHLRKNIISRWEKECLKRNFAIGQLRFKSIGFKLPRVLIFYLLVKFIYSEKVTKFCEISTLLLSYVVPVKSRVDISQNFEAFSDYMNFKHYRFQNLTGLIILKQRKFWSYTFGRFHFMHYYISGFF